jgi:hypothetical protein
MGAGHSDLSAGQRDALGSYNNGKTLDPETFKKAARENSVANFQKRTKNILDRSPRNPNAYRSMIGPRNMLSGMSAPTRGMNYGGYGGGFNQGYGQSYGGGYGGRSPQGYGGGYGQSMAPISINIGGGGMGGGYGGGYGSGYGGGSSYGGGYGYGAPSGMYGGGYGNYSPMGGGYPQRTSYPFQGQSYSQQMNSLSNLFRSPAPQQNYGFKYPGLINNFYNTLQSDPDRMSRFMDAIYGTGQGTEEPAVEATPEAIPETIPTVDPEVSGAAMAGLNEANFADIGNVDAMAQNYAAAMAEREAAEASRSPVVPDQIIPSPAAVAANASGRRGRGRLGGRAMANEVVEATAPIMPPMGSIPGIGIQDYSTPEVSPRDLRGPRGRGRIGGRAGVAPPIIPAMGSIPGLEGIPGIGSLPGGGVDPGANLAIPGIPGIGSLPGPIPAPQSVVAPTFSPRRAGPGPRRGRR